MTPKHRTETRNQRYDAKAQNAQRFPITPVCFNFLHEENVAFVVRAAACYGAHSVAVVGSIPDRAELRPRSGGLSDRVEIQQFKNPSDFLAHVRNQGGHIVAAELTEDAQSIFEYLFPVSQHVWLVLGHEETGVPEEILLAADAVVKIPMPGVGFSLNCSQSANAFLFEYFRQRTFLEAHQSWTPPSTTTPNT